MYKDIHGGGNICTTEKMEGNQMIKNKRLLIKIVISI